MKRSLYLLLIPLLFSCNQNAEKSKAPKSRADYLRNALQSDEYKNASKNVQRVKDILDSVKKGTMDTMAAIFVYNNSIATPTTQVKTVAEVKEGMKKDTAFLKSVQLKAANELASADSAKIKR
ncbi:MAG: hypothetical protein JST50_15405 [Bacteroidetes bacterium]|jgi:hypothetical protein|nr:hypothetical protein [Bacteroidota bacterium]